MQVRKAGLIGGGVIGAGWAARLLLNGIDVAVYDPDPDLARKLDAVLGNARRAWAKLYTGARPAEGKVRLAASVEDAVADADFVQESLPEREDLKRRILGAIDAHTRPEVVIGSSTSGLLPTRLQADLSHPGRFAVGHPFNPVYLLPLVEICGGDRTDPATKAWLGDFYASLGMQPLQVQKEIDGFIADRLLEAVWREALWLINDGIATTTEIDDAIRYGAGLRWSFMGTFLTYRLAGGEAGMRHFLAQFGPTMNLPWTKLVGPALTDELAERIAQQSDDQAAGVSIRQLERLRDDCLVAVLSALRACDYAAGATVKRQDQRFNLGAGPVAPRRLDETRPLVLHGVTVPAEWIDYNGHMTEHRYLQLFGETTDAVMRYIGADAAYLAAGHSFYTVETHIRNLGESREGQRLDVSTQVLGADDKRMHLFHAATRSADRVVVATAEQMLLHVDTKAGRAVPADAEIAARLAAIYMMHKGLPLPDGAGRYIGARPAR